MKKDGRKLLGATAVVGILAVCLVLRLLLPMGKGGEKEPESISGFAFDTVYTITVHSVEPGVDSGEVLQSCIGKCEEYERIFSRTAEGSELYQINQISDLYKTAVEQTGKLGKGRQKDIARQVKERCPEENKLSWQLGGDGVLAVEVSGQMYQLLEKGLYYAGQSEGAFDISIAPVSSLWDFTSGEHKVPAASTLQSALSLVDYQALALKNQGKRQILFRKPGMQLDLGGIAKGFIADALKEYLLECGVTGAVISLGGNVLCIGSKAEKEAFKIGVQQPFADRNETVAVVKASDLSVVSSGIYERCFEEEGKLYHHILNPKDGMPFDNDLMAVTILSEKSVDGDGLSTTCFALGRERGMQYINSLEGAYAMFITRDEKLWYSDGFEKFLAEEN